MDMKVKKRDGRIVPFEQSKIADAIFKAVKKVGGTDRDLAETLASKVTDKITPTQDQDGVIWIENIQDAIEKELVEAGHYKTAKEFITYRRKRSEARQINSGLNQVIKELVFVDAEEVEDKRENANIDGNSTCGIMLKVGGAVTKNFLLRNCMKEEHAQMHRDGKIHYHDMDLGMLCVNCLQCPLDKLLANGFCTGHSSIRPPSTIQTAATLTAIVLQANQNDCFKLSGAF